LLGCPGAKLSPDSVAISQTFDMVSSLLTSPQLLPQAALRFSAQRLLNHMALSQLYQSLVVHNYRASSSTSSVNWQKSMVLAA